MCCGSDPAHGEDGFLQASEIVQMRLNADMVVLSACDSALGPVEGEEGIAALSRAFLLAGARSVVSTLWSIDDTFSSFLMKQFYGHLAANMPPALGARCGKARHGEQIRPVSAAVLLGRIHCRRSRGPRCSRGRQEMKGTAMSLSERERTEILGAIRKQVLKHHFNVGGVNYDDWFRLMEERTPLLLAGDTEAFETGVQQLLLELGGSHTVFYHESANRFLPQHTINASLRQFEHSGESSMVLP